MLNKQITKALTPTSAPITRCPESLCAIINDVYDLSVLDIFSNTTNNTTNSNGTNNAANNNNVGTNNNNAVINNLYLNNYDSTNQ